jgi:zinc transport system ATP-binding protein
MIHSSIYFIIMDTLFRYWFLLTFCYVNMLAYSMIDLNIINIFVSNHTAEYKINYVKWYFINYCLYILFKFITETLAKFIAGIITYRLEEVFLQEFTSCNLELQKMLARDYKAKSEAAVRTVNMLINYMPIILHNTVQTLGVIVYRIYHFEAVFDIYLNMTMAVYIIAVIVFKYVVIPHIASKSRESAKIVGPLRKLQIYLETSMYDRCLHGNQRSVIHSSVDVSSLIERTWTTTGLYSFAIVQGAFPLIFGTITTTAVYFTINTVKFTYSTWKMYYDLQLLAQSILKYYSDYSKNTHNISDFNVFRQKYKKRRLELQIENVQNISIRSINYTTNTFTIALQCQIDIDMNSNDLILIRGSNGAGKTTLCKIISGEIENVSADILVNGKTAPGGFLQIMNNRVVVTQSDDISIIYQNWFNIITDFAPVNEENKEKVLTCINIVSLYNLLLIRYNGDIYRIIGNISGGERRKISIARAIYRSFNRRCLKIFDEPDAGVDNTLVDIVNAIKKNLSGPIIITLQNNAYIAKLQVNQYYTIDKGIVYRQHSIE